MVLFAYLFFLFSFLFAVRQRAAKVASGNHGHVCKVHKGVVSLGLDPILPREAGQVRGGEPFKAGFLLYQSQLSPTMQTRAMIMKTFIVLLSI